MSRKKKRKKNFFKKKKSNPLGFRLRSWCLMNSNKADTPQRADISKFFESAEDTLAERTSSLLAKRDDKNLALLAAMKRRPTKKDVESPGLSSEKLTQFLEGPTLTTPEHGTAKRADGEEGSTVSSDDDDEEMSRSYTALAKAERSSSSGASTPESLNNGAIRSLKKEKSSNEDAREDVSSEPSSTRKLPIMSHEDSSSHMGDTTETTGLNRRNREGIKMFYENGAVALNAHQSFRFESGKQKLGVTRVVLFFVVLQTQRAALEEVEVEVAAEVVDQERKLWQRTATTKATARRQVTTMRAKACRR